MIIDTHRKFIFIATSKTASTSLESVLGPGADFWIRRPAAKKHLFLSTVLREFRGELAVRNLSISDLFKFAVMRDPIDWIQSWYRYRISNEIGAPLPKGTTFDEFFFDLRDWNVIQADGSKNLQKDRFTLDCQFGLDLLIDYSNLQAGFSKIRKRLGITSELSYLNVSNMKCDHLKISQSTKRELREFYAEDYEFYHRYAT